MKIFLAGPFFNPPARIMLIELLSFLEGDLHHEVFCAMRDGAMVPKDAPEEMRQKYFLLDVSKMHWADCVVALLDYPLPLNQQLCIVELAPKHQPKYKLSITDIQLPDMGTVFEMGLAYALEKPIIGYATKIPSLNLMLAQSCKIIVSNINDLNEAIIQIGNQTLKDRPSGKELFQL